LRKLIGIAALIVALGIPTAALAANLHNGQGSTCDGIATWHFVNNQTGGAAPGTLTAIFSTGTVTTGPSAVNSNVQHFIVQTTGDVTLVNASTNLPGRLVLSDLTCDEGKKDKK
jgi:hypothetical protein